METVGWLLFALGCIRGAVSLCNWLVRPYLPPAGSDVQVSVSVLIPARNEEQNIGRLLDDLTASDLELMEIIVYDDDSSDDTAARVLQRSRQCPCIRLVRGEAPPHGWLGKNYACWRLAAHATGQVLLFLDADVRVAPGFVRKITSYRERLRLDLVSLFPRQLMDDPGSRVTVPLMNLILLSLLPLPLVRLSRRPSLAAANGQCMCFPREGYLRMQPHRRFRAEKTEDIAIARYYKRQHLRISTLLGHHDINCRMYHSLQEAIAGFSKNIFDFFGGSRLLGFLYALATTMAPVVIFGWNGPVAGGVYVAIVIAIHVLVSLTSGQNAARNLGLLIPQQALLWAIMASSLFKQSKKELSWKDRNISGQ